MRRTNEPAFTGTGASGAKSSPLAHHQVPESTTHSRSDSYQCGALMKPGCQRISTKYWPGSETLPTMGAVSAAPLGKLYSSCQGIWSGGVIIVIVGSTPAAFTLSALSIANAAANRGTAIISRRVLKSSLMSPPP